MPVPAYGVLVGTLKDKLDSQAALDKNPDGSPHYELLLDSNGESNRVAINVKSNENPVDLLFFLDDNYQNPVTASISNFKVGYTPLHSTAGSGALDFLRMNLFDLTKMRVVPAMADSISGNDLNDIFTVHLNQSQKTPGSLLYVFGSRWNDPKTDPYFDFQPGTGIHDIHMNQGDEKMKHANGVYQDGAFFIHYPDENRWVAMFLRFQSQSTDTDNHGNPK
ncbi:YukJ family protein [Mucilaginibacter flavus]|uniref:YukJ family protein n=1 Tax=Mucilaginibacter flavus TaxID=931504 RepID=UPI0025B50633|nr:YukJ family protein [Mucilaginibacter flavus]MDN3580905.1 YukJ family protein [Mucilaginibacter flavus]